MSLRTKPRILPELVSTIVLGEGVLTTTTEESLDGEAATAESCTKLEAAVPPARIAALCISRRRLTFVVEILARFSSIIFLLLQLFNFRGGSMVMRAVVGQGEG